MKQKLTLTIDGEAVAKAKAFASRHSTSLSRMVEKQFASLGEPSFAQLWRRKLKPIERKPASRDERLRYLEKKYLKD